jgi:hypothetical protein
MVIGGGGGKKKNKNNHYTLHLNHEYLKSVLPKNI